MENIASPFKNLPDLAFNDSYSNYVAPPMAQYRALGQAREDDYIKSRNNKNTLEAIINKIPKDYSPELYNSLKAKSNEVLSSINPDNYADKVLDTEQFAHDLMNKYGANELLDEASQIGEAFKYYDDAVTKGDIVDPNKAQWLKQQTLQKRQPLNYNEDGSVQKPNVKPIPYAKYINGQELVDKTVKDWKANGTFRKNADGTYDLIKPIPGLIGFEKTTGITEQELLQGGIRTLQNNAEYQAYLNQDADYKVSKIPPTAENLLNVLTDARKEALGLPKDATVEDIQNAINSGDINPVQTLKTIYKGEEMNNAAKTPAEKYSYLDEELTTVKDDFTLAMLKAQSDAQKERRKTITTEDNSTTDVIVSPFMVHQVMDRDDVKAIVANKNKLIQDRKTKQADIYSYKKRVEADLKLPENQRSYTQEKLDLKNQELQVLDKQIEEQERQEKSLAKIMYDNGKKAGIDLNKTYKESYNQSLNHTTQANIEAIKTNNATVDITEKVVIHNGVPTVSVTRNGNLIEVPIDSKLQEVTKVGDRYIFTPSKGYRIPADSFKDIMFNKDGSLSDKVDTKNVSKSKFFKVPTEEDYNKMAAKAYADEESTSIFGKTGKPYTMENGADNYQYMVDNKFVSDLEKIREKQGDFKWDIATPLSTIFVDGATKKDSEKAYISMENNLRKEILTQPGQFEIDTPQGKVSLGTYMKEKYGIPNISPEMIDWEETSKKSKILLQTDRERGQKIGLNIVLTKEARDNYLTGGANEVYSSDNSIKLVGLRSADSAAASQAHMKDVILKMYPNIYTDDSEHGIRLQKELGAIYMNNSEEGRSLKALNLYTMAAGDVPKQWSAGGIDYQINSTAKDAENSDLNNVDFHLSAVQNNQVVTLATNVDKKSPNYGKQEWKPIKGLDDDKTWNRVIFESPEDIAAVVGGKLLEDTYKKTKAVPEVDYYQNYLNEWKKTQQGVQTDSYDKIRKNVQTIYKEVETIQIINRSTNKVTNLLSRISQEELYDFSKSVPEDKIKEGVRFPYVNKNVANNVEKFINEEPVLVTGGFRGDEDLGAENSLHKTGHGLDIRYSEEVYNKLISNPNLLKQYGIIKFEHHTDPDHIHIEFAPDTF